MSASTLPFAQNSTAFAMLGNVVYTSPFASTQDLSSTSWVQQDNFGGVPGVSLSVSGVFEFAIPGTYDIQSQVVIQTPADICSGTGFGGIGFTLIPSAGSTCHIQGSTSTKMDGASDIAQSVVSCGGLAYISTSGATLSSSIKLPADCVSKGGAGEIDIVGGGATRFDVKRVA